MNLDPHLAKFYPRIFCSRVPIVHGDLKPSDVLIDAHSGQPKVTNFGLWDFKNYFLRATMPEGSFLNPCQAPEILLSGKV